jgi:hypothetical protein
MLIAVKGSWLFWKGKKYCLSYTVDIFVSFPISDTTGELSVTQTSSSLSLNPGESTTLSCRVSQGVGSYLAWYKQKPAQIPRLLVFSASTRATDALIRFSGSGSGTDFTLTISSLEPEDVAVYYCQPFGSWSSTVIQHVTKNSVRPSMCFTLTSYFLCGQLLLFWILSFSIFVYNRKF